MELNRATDERLYYLSSSTNIIRTMRSRRMRSVGHVVRVGRTEIHNVFGRESEGKRPFGKPIRR